MMLCVLELDLNGCKLVALTALPVILFLLHDLVNVPVQYHTGGNGFVSRNYHLVRDNYFGWF